jgi:hypothetical protein
MASLRAACQAFAAADTFHRQVLDFGAAAHGFGIVAPEAPQVAALEKDRGSDARSVMDAKTLDVE